MAVKRYREMKVYEQSGYKYKTVPAIILKRAWLGEFGFSVGDTIAINCQEGQLTISKCTYHNEKSCVPKELNCK